MVVERVAMTPSYYVCGDNSTRHSGNINPTFRGKKIYGGVAGPSDSTETKQDEPPSKREVNQP